MTSKQAGMARRRGFILVFKTLPSGVVMTSPMGLGGASGSSLVLCFMYYVLMM